MRRPLDTRKIAAWTGQPQPVVSPPVSQSRQQRPINARQRLRQILCNEARADAKRGLSVEPHRRGRRLEGRHPLRQKPRRHSGQHIAGSGGRQVRWSVGRNGCSAVRGRDHRVRAFEEHDGVGQPRSKARPVKFRSDLSMFIQGAEISKKFSLVGR